MKKTFIALAVLASTVSASAFAEVGDSVAASTIADFSARMTGDLTLVGLAMISLAALAVGFKWIKGALFG